METSPPTVAIKATPHRGWLLALLLLEVGTFRDPGDTLNAVVNADDMILLKVVAAP